MMEHLQLFLKKPVAVGFFAGFLLGVCLLSYLFRERVLSAAVGGTSETALVATLKAEIVGAVEKPGVYELPVPSRLIDLVEKSGGFSKQASGTWVRKNINLAEQVKDSAKIYIPSSSELALNLDTDCMKKLSASLVESLVLPNTSGSTTGQTPSTADSGTSDDIEVVDVNTALAEELDVLPGIGPASSEKIILNRPYENFDELAAKTKLAASTLEKIKLLIKF